MKIIYTLPTRFTTNHEAINYHDSPNYYVAWILNFERISSLRQSQYEVLTYE